jgi:hypothetical protein
MRESTYQTKEISSQMINSTDKIKHIYTASHIHILDKLEEIINSNIMEKKFWDLETDEAFNFYFYFKGNNPDNSTSFFTKEKKKTFASCFEK